MTGEPYIPTNIVVHLGVPNSNAQNVTIPFPDYIKNVASSEIYPTWPESAIRANIYAQISFALNRIYTEWYPSRGYDFDITNETQYDQKFINGRNIFENISQIVDEIFNSYVVRQGYVEPLFTAYCSGRSVTCDGLEQWGTVELANDGLTPYQILQYYYGEDINIVDNAPVRINIPSYPGRVLRQGEQSGDVQQIQLRLNRIRRNYPAIPAVRTDGSFDSQTTESVKKFQSIFDLVPDGLVGKETWYRIGYIYTSVKRLAELDAEGLMLSELPQGYQTVLQYGDSGTAVEVIQYYLSVLAKYYNTIPDLVITGEFDADTRSTVVAFQKQFGLTPDGIVGRNTWNQLYSAYRGIILENPTSEGIFLYPGYFLEVGSSGEAVVALQTYLLALSEVFNDIPAVTVDGQFGKQTENAVKAFQTRFSLNANGIVGPVTWNAITTAYSDL